MKYISKEILFMILIVIISICGMWFVINIFADKMEIAECKDWSVQAVNLKQFYITQWQADQCKAHRITINAPVK